MMDTMFKDVNVSDDHIILSEIILENDITVKQLASSTGLAASTLYKFLAGTCTIPSIIWRVVFKMTRDARIARLVTGDVPLMMVPLGDVSGSKETADIAGMIKVRQGMINFERDILEVISSDTTDNEKQRAIEALKQKFPKLISSQTQLFQAITGSFSIDE